ncbi:MAG: iron-sulfur protein [Spirochaetales bacterium]|nr:iron-sulfur protein [Spirochaetales bacterium]
MKSLGAAEICALAKKAGFHKSEVISGKKVYEILACQHNAVFKHNLVQTVTSSFGDLSRPFTDCSLLVSALSCHRQEADDLSTADDPHTLVAPFARRNYYREAVKKMQKIARSIREQTGLPKQSLRIFCNSHVPEKLLGALSGLGFYGKNSLLICPGLGSRHVIAILLLPFSIDSEKEYKPPEVPGLQCGDCTACSDACPTRALRAPGKLDTKLCLQSLSTELIILPERFKTKWAYRLYGCESCQSVCPYNSGLSETTAVDSGAIGPSVSIATLLQLSLPEWKSYFKHTPMGLSWIHPYVLMRNTLLAAGNRKNKALLPYLLPYTRHENMVLRDAALWAKNMIGD